MASQIPQPTVAQIEDRQRRIQAAASAFLYHCQKQQLNVADGLVVLASAFASLKDTQATVDQKTELRMLFVSMIENPPNEKPASPIIKP